MKSKISRCAGWRHVAAALVVATLIAGPIAAAAQERRSLAEIARQEQERRKAIKVPSKVYSGQDLKHITPAPPKDTPAAMPPASSPGAASAVAAPPAASAAETGSGKDEAYWKKRMDGAREEVRRSEMFTEALQSRVSALSNDFVGRDDPFQRAKIGEDRQKALAELDRVKADFEKAKKQISDIEEEARAAGVPPGWIR